MSFQEYEKRWNELFADKTELQEKLDKLYEGELIMDKITLEELKIRTSQIISQLNENNERFERLHDNEELSLQEYERKWDRLFQEKIELQKELDELHERELILKQGGPAGEENN